MKMITKNVFSVFNLILQGTNFVLVPIIYFPEASKVLSSALCLLISFSLEDNMVFPSFLYLDFLQYHYELEQKKLCSSKQDQICKG